MSALSPAPQPSAGTGTASRARVLPLPRLSGAEAAALNRMHRWRASLPLPGNETFSLRLLDIDVPLPPPDARLQLSFQLGHDRFQADLPRALMLDLMRSLDSELRLDPLPPPDLAALLLEGALLPLADAMERGLQRPLALHALEASETADAPAAPAAPFRTILLTGGGLHQLLRVAGEAPALARMLDGWPSGRRPLDALPLPGRVCLGNSLLTVGLLRSLRVGDAVLLQHVLCTLGTDGTASAARLHVAERLGAPVRRTAAGWCLEAPLQPIRRTSKVSENGSSADNGHPGTPTPVTHHSPGDVVGDKALDALPVRLVFEAGRLELSLGALRRLGAGSILQFEGEPGQVAILTGERRIGTGTLMDVDGRPGVRIDSFSDALEGDAGHPKGGAGA